MQQTATMFDMIIMLERNTRRHIVSELSCGLFITLTIRQATKILFYQLCRNTTQEIQCLKAEMCLRRKAVTTVEMSQDFFHWWDGFLTTYLIGESSEIMSYGSLK